MKVPTAGIRQPMATYKNSMFFNSTVSLFIFLGMQIVGINNPQFDSWPGTLAVVAACLIVFPFANHKLEIHSDRIRFRRFHLWFQDYLFENITRVEVGSKLGGLRIWTDDGNQLYFWLNHWTKDPELLIRRVQGVLPMPMVINPESLEAAHQRGEPFETPFRPVIQVDWAAFWSPLLYLVGISAIVGPPFISRLSLPPLERNWLIACYLIMAFGLATYQVLQTKKEVMPDRKLRFLPEGIEVIDSTSPPILLPKNTPITVGTGPDRWTLYTEGGETVATIDWTGLSYDLKELLDEATRYGWVRIDRWSPEVPRS